jgi:leucyl aminopeptidase
MTPRFADPTAPTRPLHVVLSDDLPAWRATRPADEQAWLTASGFEAALGELRLLPGANGVGAAVLGLGTAKARARSRFGAVKGLSALPAGAWALHGTIAPELEAELALGWLLSLYRFDRYRPGKTAPDPALLAYPAGPNAARLLAMAEGEFLTRDLINTPASDMGPAELEAAFVALGQRFGATTEVIRGDHLLARGFPMVHAVGRASPRAPRIMDLRWGTIGPALTLVGKGVCFDTGGLNIKAGTGMSLMKKDMGGAATVMGLAQMIMALNLPLRLRVIVPSVENVIGGNALKPKDILTTRLGLTVEVNDTDAEGRLILSDALTWADEEAPALIISMATLTGAARVAVGPDLAPFYADSDADAAALTAGATDGFDPVWRLPFHTPYEPVIEPGIADLDNAPGWGFAGSVTAALFLHRFVEKARYMHFDIYGHSPADAPARPKGAVGQGARALLLSLPKMLGM